MTSNFNEYDPAGVIRATYKTLKDKNSRHNGFTTKSLLRVLCVICTSCTDICT